MLNPVVGRYAPSPSGRMHLGNAFTAVLAWLFSRSQDGIFLLRIEDLDVDRCKWEYALQVREDLRWLGLDWDQEGTPQSKRSAAYDEAFQLLCSKADIYPCFCSRADLHAADAPHASDGSQIYPGTCRYLTEEQRSSMLRKPAFRIQVPDCVISFQDLLQGEYSENLNLNCGDFILRRSDGIYAYQLAVCVDDAAMGVNQIVRGKDLLSSTPRQIWLLSLLGYPEPQYCHVPLICGPDGRRLSKRNMDIDFSYMRLHKKPEEVLGLIGFASGILERCEPVCLSELLSAFSPERLHRDNFLLTKDLLF